MPEFNTLIVLLKRMIGTLEGFKCNEIPAKQFRIMMLKVLPSQPLTMYPLKPTSLPTPINTHTLNPSHIKQFRIMMLKVLTLSSHLVDLPFNHSLTHSNNTTSFQPTC